VHRFRAGADARPETRVSPARVPRRSGPALPAHAATYLATGISLPGVTMAAVVVVLWLLSTLSWWAFAFMPLPSAAPAWVEAAREVCFGSMETGLPGAAGFILLVVAPLTFLGPMVALWGFDLVRSVRRLAGWRAGQALLAVLALTVLVEAGWVAQKIGAAQRIATAGAAVDVPGELPRDYPVQATVAPDFALVDQHGETVTLRRFAGRPVVLTFVFAHCQTMCPVLIETIKQASVGAPPSEALLVTLDPWRDTVRTLPGIAQRWNVPPGFHVLSARRVDDVLGVANAYNVPFERDAKTGDVTHPGLVFVIDARGHIAFTFNNPPVRWVRDALDRLGRSARNVA
jgi:cytochrome oxidase Cu insertion factor (SCO1/SenC/PrrC family)